jgi:hypothetical protein
VTRRDCRTVERYKESEGREAVRYGIRRACYAYGVTPEPSRSRPGLALASMRQCVRRAGPALAQRPDGMSVVAARGLRISGTRVVRGARAAGGIRATDGRCEIRSPRTAGGGTRTCNIEDPSRETVTRYPSTPVLARYCHLPYRTVHVSRRGVHRKSDETRHTPPGVSKPSRLTQLSVLTVPTRICPISPFAACPWGYRQPTYAPRLCSQDHWICDMVPPPATRRRPAWTAHALEVDAWLRRAA